jgi:prolyl oligopeptidase
VVDVLHGVEVADPYRWLEDGTSAEVADWVAAQNARTRGALDGRPDRAAWRTRLLPLAELPVVLGAQVRGAVLVTLERAGGAPQAALVARPADDPDASPVVLADPAAGAADAAAAVDWFSVSPDGTLVAVGVSEGGTEDSVLRVVRTADGSTLDDPIPHTRACSVAWDADGTGFHYTRYPEGDQYHRTVHHHTIGASWGDDPVVWAEHVTPETWPSVTASADGRYLLVTAMVGWSRTDLHLLDRRTGAWQVLVEGVEATTALDFTADGSALVGVTTLDAPKGRLVRLDLTPNLPADPSAWRTLVPERDLVLGGSVLTADTVLLVTTRRAVDAIERWGLDGSPSRGVEGLGAVAVDGLTADPATGRAFAIVSGFDAPAALSRLDGAADPGSTILRRPWLPRLDPAQAAALPRLVVETIDYLSTDGTVIGMFLLRDQATLVGADTPTILTGYGGFAIANTPAFSPLAAAWCAAGGQYAVAGLRGGYEHGEEWHQAGRRGNKQRVFDDFHAAADHLVRSGRTDRDHLAIAGGSNGGLLVGAALTQRPDLARAVWCAVPLLDMIRFPQFLIARLWTDEYGDPDVAEEFDWLYAYSPYHHVRPATTYPAVLLTTAEGDTRVDPLHARKMAAALQAVVRDQQARPVLLHQESRAGHGVGKPVTKRVEEWADVLSFLSWQLGVDGATGAGA